jgi:putative DNA methylase
MGARLLAIVAEGPRGRVYLSPSETQERAADIPAPGDTPATEMPEQALGFRVQAYGMTKHSQLFTPRQLAALTAFSDLVEHAQELVFHDAVAAGMEGQPISLSEGGTGALAYAEAVATYLALGVSRMTNTLCTIARWTPTRDQAVTAFARQAIPMSWDYPEVNPFAGAAGDFAVTLSSIAKVLQRLPTSGRCTSVQANAMQIPADSPGMVSTDPPYYDNIGYADLSDFFYIWLRRSLRKVYPDLFSTLLVPKTQELVATPYRFGGNTKKAEEFFENGLGRAFVRMREAHDPRFPLTVYYAFKQSETEEDNDGHTAVQASTGWETMLEGLLAAGFLVVGTWPMRSERSNRPVASGTNALASSIVLVCRPRSADAPLATRKEFVGALKRELPDALRKLQHGNIAPVDLAQATIGPGMAVFSRYAKVLEPDGSAMRVRASLGLINQALDEVLSEQEGEYDADTRWAIAWFDQFGMEEKEYGLAETLSKAKDTAVSGLVQAGIIAAGKGKVRLLARTELPNDWDPRADQRLTVWEVAQYLIRALDRDGEPGAANLLRQVGYLGETARDLAYRLYVTCERKKWASEALAYNSLVVAWPEITKLAASAGPAPGPQTLF